MIENILIVAVIDGILMLFFGYGYYLGKSNNSPAENKTNAGTVRKKLAFRGSVIDYPTQADIDYRESGEEKTDQARTELFEQYFKP